MEIFENIDKQEYISVDHEADRNMVENLINASQGFHNENDQVVVQSSTTVSRQDKSLQSEEINEETTANKRVEKHLENSARNNAEIQATYQQELQLKKESLVVSNNTTNKGKGFHFKCKECGKKFSSTAGLKSHMKNHSTRNDKNYRENYLEISGGNQLNLGESENDAVGKAQDDFQIKTELDIYDTNFEIENSSNQRSSRNESMIETQKKYTSENATIEGNMTVEPGSKHPDGNI